MPKSEASQKKFAILLSYFRIPTKKNRFQRNLLNGYGVRRWLKNVGYVMTTSVQKWSSFFSWSYVIFYFFTVKWPTFSFFSAHCAPVLGKIPVQGIFAQTKFPVPQSFSFNLKVSSTGESPGAGNLLLKLKASWYKENIKYRKNSKSPGTGKIS